MDKNRKGALDALLAPFGNQIVDPNGQVSAMLDTGDAAKAEAARKAEEERKRLAALAAEKSAMEAAAASPQTREMSGWNPFVWLFGQPGKPGGLLGGE